VAKVVEVESGQSQFGESPRPFRPTAEVAPPA
jgi:hypothetical protein